MSLIQYAFRFYNDDGGEATSTPYAAENVNITWPLDTAIRLRIGVTHDGSAAPATSKYMLFASRQGAGQWFEVTAGGSGRIRLSKSSGSPNNIPDGGQNTTNRLTPPTVSPSPTFTPGRIWDDESGQDSVALANGQFTELEFCLAANSNLVSNGQIFDFKVYRAAAGAGVVGFNNTNTPTHQVATSFSASLSVTAGGSDLVAVAMIVAYSTGPTAPVISAVTYGGQAMTSAGTAIANAAGNTMAQIFTLVNPPTGSNTLAVTGDGNTVGIYANLVSYTGVNQTTPVRPATYNSGTGAAVATNSLVITSAVNDMTMTVASQPTAAITSTNQTSDGIDNGGSRDLGSDHAAGAATVTHTWTWPVGASYIIAGLSLQPS